MNKKQNDTQELRSIREIQHDVAGLLEVLREEKDYSLTELRILAGEIESFVNAEGTRQYIKFRDQMEQHGDKLQDLLKQLDQLDPQQKGIGPAV